MRRAINGDEERYVAECFRCGLKCGYGFSRFTAAHYIGGEESFRDTVIQRAWTLLGKECGCVAPHRQWLLRAVTDR